METSAVVDLAMLRLFVRVVAGWLADHRQEGVAYLVEENRIPWAPSCPTCSESHRRIGNAGL